MRARATRESPATIASVCHQVQIAGAFDIVGYGSPDQKVQLRRIAGQIGHVIVESVAAVNRQAGSLRLESSLHFRPVEVVFHLAAVTGGVEHDLTVRPYQRHPDGHLIPPENVARRRSRRLI